LDPDDANGSIGLGVGWLTEQRGEEEEAPAPRACAVGRGRWVGGDGEVASRMVPPVLPWGHCCYCRGGRVWMVDDGPGCDGDDGASGSGVHRRWKKGGVGERQGASGSVREQRRGGSETGVTGAKGLRACVRRTDRVGVAPRRWQRGGRWSFRISLRLPPGVWSSGGPALGLEVPGTQGGQQGPPPPKRGGGGPPPGRTPASISNPGLLVSELADRCPILARQVPPATHVPAAARLQAKKIPGWLVFPGRDCHPTTHSTPA